MARAIRYNIYVILEVEPQSPCGTLGGPHARTHMRIRHMCGATTHEARLSYVLVVCERNRWSDNRFGQNLFGDQNEFAAKIL